MTDVDAGPVERQGRGLGVRDGLQSDLPVGLGDQIAQLGHADARTERPRQREHERRRVRLRRD